MRNAIGSKQAATLMHMPLVAEPGYLQQLQRSANGVFMGMSKDHNVPCFLDFDQLLNPHMFIVGMTGSGKTYFMRSLILRLLSSGARMVIFDFTGEFEQFSGLRDPNVSYIGMKGVGNDEKIARATVVLEGIAAGMRLGAAGYGKRTFVIMDEAWKVIQRGKSIETLVREGRKYGIGMVFASQTMGDASPEIMGNIASLFVFRLQDRGSLLAIGTNYGVASSDMETIQGLGLGCCFHIAIYRHDARQAFFMGRMRGISLSAKTRIKVSRNMEIEIAEDRLREIVREACTGSGAYSAVEHMLKGREVSVQRLSERLLKAGLRRGTVLRMLRNLRIPERDIADAFSLALASGAERHGKAD